MFVDIKLNSESADHPLVSVGVPTYNRPDGLRMALQCLISQTYPNLEIIVSDNCSTGVEVEQLMHEVMMSETRIRYFRQNRNIGGIANFEFVLKEATGKYFIWVADDDLCESGFIEELVDCMKKHPDLVLCTCDVQAIDENDNPLETNRLESIRLSENWERARRLFFRYPTSNIFFCIYGLYKTEILRRCNIQAIVSWRGFATYGEVPFLAQIALLGRVAAIPEVLKIYRRHPDSLYHKEAKRLSKFDTFMLSSVIRLKLCNIALRGGNSSLVKLSLLNAIVTSFITSFISIQVKGTISAILPAGVKRRIKIYSNKLLHLRR